MLGGVAADGTFRRRRPGALLFEAVAVGVALAVAGVIVYFVLRPPPLHNDRPIGGRNVDVSRAIGAQYEARVAADPADPRLLLAASIDGSDDALVYTSADGGASWHAAPAPPAIRAPCGLSHPAVAIGPGHLQVFASLVSDTCQPPDPHLYVGTRRGSTGKWTVREIAPTPGFWFDQRPVVAVDARGRIAVAWTRLLGEITSRQVVLVSTSDDGRAWSAAKRVRGYTGVYSVDLAAAPSGDVYLAVADGRGRALDLLRSRDGGQTWPVRRRLARLVEPYVVGCGAGAASVPAQPQRCVGPSPSIAVEHAGAAVVVYSEPEENRTQAVYVVRADRALRSSSRARRVGPPDAHPADQFLPVAAYDRSTRDLWACYYDTAGDPRRRSTWFTCTRSRGGGSQWSRPVRAASAPSDETQTASDAFGYGEAAGLVAAGGVAHPLWTDTRRAVDAGEEIYATAIPAPPRG
jgi:hypothetical protein